MVYMARVEEAKRDIEIRTAMDQRREKKRNEVRRSQHRNANVGRHLQGAAGTLSTSNEEQ